MFRSVATHLGCQFFSACRIGLRHEPLRAQSFFGVKSRAVAEGIMDMEPEKIRELCSFGLPYVIQGLPKLAKSIHVGMLEGPDESDLPDWERRVISVVLEHIQYVYHWATHDPGQAALWARISCPEDLEAITSLELGQFKSLAQAAYNRIQLDPTTSMQLAIVFCHQEAAMDRLVVSRSVCPIAA